MQPLTAGDPRQVGAYRLHSRLGAGGMGRVFLGFSPAGRAVAVKVIHPELARDPEFLRRFRREVGAAEAVSGAYTAPVVAAGPDDDPPWLATAFVPGPSLTEVVAEAGPLPDAAVWRLAGGLIEALDAVHALGLVHRDLKPSNVLIAADGPRVIDFGISRALDATSMTSSQVMAGTPAFMSPEQAQGIPVGPSADVFALGSVIAYAATGAAPFGGGEPIAVAYRVVHAEPDLSRLSGPLRDLVAACLAKDPADRPRLSGLLSGVTDPAAALAGVARASFWPEPVASVVSGHQDSLRAWVSGTDASAGDTPGRLESAGAGGSPATAGFVLVGTVSAGLDAGGSAAGLDDVTTMQSLLPPGWGAEPGSGAEDAAAGPVESGAVESGQGGSPAPAGGGAAADDEDARSGAAAGAAAFLAVGAVGMGGMPRPPGPSGAASGTGPALGDSAAESVPAGERPADGAGAGVGAVGAGLAGGAATAALAAGTPASGLPAGGSSASGPSASGPAGVGQPGPPAGGAPEQTVPGLVGQRSRRWSRRAVAIAVAVVLVAVVSVATGISLLGTSSLPRASAGARTGTGGGATGPGQLAPAGGRNPGDGAGPGGASRPAPAKSGSRPGSRTGHSPASSSAPSPSPSVVSVPAAPPGSSTAAVTVTLCVQPSSGCTAATMQVAPSQIALTVNGSAAQVTGIAWSNWGSSSATGTGTLVKSSCLLSCRVPVTLTAASPQAYAAGESAYSTLKLVSSSTLGLLTSIVTGLVP